MHCLTRKGNQLMNTWLNSTVECLCKQYMKSKPIKWGFKCWCRFCSKTGYLYELDLYLGKKEKTEEGLGETVVLDLSMKLESMHTVCFNFTTALILQHWLRSFSIE